MFILCVLINLGKDKATTAKGKGDKKGKKGKKKGGGNDGDSSHILPVSSFFYL